MAKFLLFESVDPLESRSADDYWEMAADLAGKGHSVTVALVDNGVFAARKGAQWKALETARGKGVELVADEFSLAERAITTAKLAAGVRVIDVQQLVAKLADEDAPRTLWH